MSLRKFLITALTLNCTKTAFAADKIIRCEGIDRVQRKWETQFESESNTFSIKALGTLNWIKIFGANMVCARFSPSYSCRHEINSNLDDSSSPNKFFGDSIFCASPDGSTASSGKFSAQFYGDRTGAFSCDVQGTERYRLALSKCAVDAVP